MKRYFIDRVEPIYFDLSEGSDAFTFFDTETDEILGAIEIQYGGRVRVSKAGEVAQAETLSTALRSLGGADLGDWDVPDLLFDLLQLEASI